MIYGESPRILTKNKKEIAIEIGGRRIRILPKDKIWVLTDAFVDELNDNKGYIFSMDFDYFYENIDGKDDSGDYDFTGDLRSLCGISLIRR